MRVRVLLSVVAVLSATALPAGAGTAAVPDGSCGQSRYAAPRLSLHAPQAPRPGDHTLVVGGTLTLDRCGLGGHTVALYGRTAPGAPFRYLGGASTTTYDGPPGDGDAGEWGLAVGPVRAALDLVAVSSARGSVRKAYSQVVHRPLRKPSGFLLGGCVRPSAPGTGDARPAGVSLQLELPPDGRARQALRGQIAVRNDSADAVTFAVTLQGGDAAVVLQSRSSGEVPVTEHFSDALAEQTVTLQQGEEVELPARLVLRSCQAPHHGPTLRPDSFDATGVLEVRTGDRRVRWETPAVPFTVTG